MKHISSLPKTIMMLGPSGSGKDTQIDLLVEKFECEKIGTGDMFRVLYEENDPDGIIAYDYWSCGKWVPDDLVYKLFRTWIKKYDISKPWIFSQAVRTVAQVDLFDGLLGKFDRELELVIYFSLSKDAAIERMSLRRFCSKCKKDYHLKYSPPKNDGVCDLDGAPLESRDDDKPEAILKRLEEFETKTQPVLDIYKSRGILLEIDASPSVDEIHAMVLKKLELVKNNG